MGELKLSCQEQLLPGDTLQEKFEAAVTAGFDGIELRGKPGFALADRLPELRKAAADGVVMPTVCVDMTWFIGDVDPQLRRDATDQLRSQLSVIAELGGYGAMTPASWGKWTRRRPPDRSPAEDTAVLLEALTELGEHARREGVWLLLEPLNRYEDHMVNTLAEARALCAEIGFDAVRVGADTYHMNIEETDAAAALIACDGALGHVQVSDSNRLEPGAGHVDWEPTLATLEALGYDGYLAYECRLSGPPREVLARSAALLRRLG